MKYSYQLISTAVVLSFIFCMTACEHQVIDEQIKLTDYAQAKSDEPAAQSQSFYFLDNQEVPEGTYALDDDRLFLLIFGGSPNDANDQNVYYYAFTTRELYLAFSDAHSLGLHYYIQFEQEVEAINIAYDVEKYYEKNGSLPKGYMEAINELYDSIFPDKTLAGGSTKGQEKLATIIRKNCGSGSTAWMPEIMPVMWPSWNNEVSAYEFWALGGIIIIYDKKFWGTHLATYVKWGLRTYCLPNGINDKMSSGFTADFP